jgi:hypothetical protein
MLSQEDLKLISMGNEIYSYCMIIKTLGRVLSLFLFCGAGQI